jgi:hypothetical protein
MQRAFQVRREPFHVGVPVIAWKRGTNRRTRSNATDEKEDDGMQTFLLVFSNPIEGKEAEYKEWYTNVHLHEVVAVKGFKSAQLFSLTKEQAVEPQSHKYCAFYQLENDDVGETVQRLQAAVPSMRLDPVLDVTSVRMSVFQSVSDVVMKQ